MDRQLIGGEDRLLRRSRGDLKGETDTEVTAVHYREMQTKYHVTLILGTEKQAANAYYINSWM